MVEESSPLLPPEEESIDAETVTALESGSESGEHAPPFSSDTCFVCDREELMRSACKRFPVYKDHQGRRYCVLHYPGKEKSADFRAALDDKLSQKDFAFQGVWFPDDLDFRGFEFTSAAHFDRATFNAVADFSDTKFNAPACFNDAKFKANSSSSSRVSEVISVPPSPLTPALSETYAVRFFKTDVRFEFTSAARFDRATFNAVADFSDTKFNAPACFKNANFKAIVRFFKTEFRAKADFSDAVFSVDARFYDTTFSADAKFAGATFSAGASFIDEHRGRPGPAAFIAVADFSYAKFKDQVEFSEFSGRDIFGDQASLDLQFAVIEKPDRVSFHNATLRPHWFVNVDPRKFVFTAVGWEAGRISIKQEIAALETNDVSSPNRLRAIACSQLAENAESNNRYEEASRFRYWAMDLGRRTRWKGWSFSKTDWLHLLYWASSGYGERILRALGVLAAVWIVFAMLYTWVGFTEQIRFPRALTYSLGVISLQRPEPRPLTSWAYALVTLETILGPVQAALLALAIRRKFMR